MNFCLILLELQRIGTYTGSIIINSHYISYETDALYPGFIIKREGREVIIASIFV